MLVDFLTNLGFILTSFYIAISGFKSPLIYGYYHFINRLIAFLGSLIELAHPFSPIWEFSIINDYLLIAGI